MCGFSPTRSLPILMLAACASCAQVSAPRGDDDDHEDDSTTAVDGGSTDPDGGDLDTGASDTGDTGTDVGTGSETGGTDTDTGASDPGDTDTGDTVTGDGTESETGGSDTETSASDPGDTDTDGVLRLFFFELMRYSESYHLHEVRVGPGDSLAPEGWTVVADAAAMDNAAADWVWAQGAVVDLSAYGGQTIRLAFHYDNGNEGSDIWALDDVCVAVTANTDHPAACPLLAETFDGVSPPTLPAGWQTIAGSNHNPLAVTFATADLGNSPPNRVQINDESMRRQDTYLVSPQLALP